MKKIIQRLALVAICVPAMASGQDAFYGSLGGGAYRLKSEGFNQTAPSTTILGGYNLNENVAFGAAYTNFLLGLSAIGLATAQMELPADFAAQAERSAISGFGGHNRGAFAFDRFKGEFTRGESRLSLLNSAYVSSKGKSSFTLRANSSDEIISGNCVMKKGAVTIDIVTFDPKKMSYQCDFAKAGQMLGARLVVGQPKAVGAKEKFLAKDLRRGEANVFNQHLLIESVHHYRGSRLQSQAPVGFLLRQGDRVVAALELTDVNPTLFVVPNISDDLRNSISATALALAVLRDPADSALDD